MYSKRQIAFKQEIHVDHCSREVQSSLDLVLVEGEIVANSLKPVIRVAMICEHFNGQNAIKRQSDFKSESHNGANAIQYVEQTSDLVPTKINIVTI